MKMQRSLNLSPKISKVDKNKPIIITSTYGTDDYLVKSLQDYENDLLKTNSFARFSKPLFSLVKKTAASVGSNLAIVKKIALQYQLGGTAKCAGTNCKCCRLICNKPITEITINSKPIRLPKANCK